MRTTSSLYLATIACAAFSLAACGGNVAVSGPGGGGGGSSNNGGSAGAAPYDACVTAADCAWGEIEHEILQPSDCVCLYGCPFVPLSNETVERRQKQYDALCTPGVDGNGNNCGIDDCATPPEIACSNGKCVAPQ